MKLIKGLYRFTVIILILVLAGCASSGKQISQSSIEKIIPGTTTKQQMHELFGSPLSQSYGTEGKLTMIWHYVFVGPFGTGMKQQNLAVLFDENEIVEKFNMVNSGDNGVRFGP
ncbi:outer membrane protein assembly factor BamE [Zobellella sp. DQSA1]|uniref:outer membrane protein assembly factor BamE n=1 Tax=Zobellella sp. DQSA1 TaxID=3342386 RepID=UPI0035C01B8A